MHRLLILNYSVWRTVAGTVAFALLVGFLHTWTPMECDRVASAMDLVWRKGKGVVDVFITNSYSAPRALRNGLMNASASRRDFLLRTPEWIRKAKPKFWMACTWPGRSENVSDVWANAPNVVTTRNYVSKRKTCESLAHAPFFGTTLAHGIREPGFFCKRAC